ncbi:MAG: sialate O-acetylesterase [Verrucomicrobia bacterium]|nr:sialate O-acetylesterase [Verrucomicrobiota bacterium]
MLFLCVAPLGAEEGVKGVPKEKLQVYLLIGQSNMAGRAPITAAEEGVLERCYLLNAKDEFEPAENPLNRYSTVRKGPGMQKLNPGYSFAKVMLEKEEGVSIGLVVNAKGGSKIEEWGKGSHFYKEAVRRAKEAEKSGTLTGVLWHQGESNSGKPEAYLGLLEELIENLREDLGMPELPFVAGQINGKEAINGEIEKLPEAVPFTGVARSEGLVAMDQWHFDTKSMKLLGERYAEAMRKVMGKAR